MNKQLILLATLIIHAIMTGYDALGARLPVSAFKNSYRLYQPDQQHLSLLNGIIASELYIKGLYFISPTTHKTATMEFCEELFYGRNPRIYFQATQSPKKIITYCSSALIASIIKSLEEAHTTKQTTPIIEETLLSIFKHDQSYQQKILEAQQKISELHAKIRILSEKIRDIEQANKIRWNTLALDYNGIISQLTQKNISIQGKKKLTTRNREIELWIHEMMQSLEHSSDTQLHHDLSAFQNLLREYHTNHDTIKTEQANLQAAKKLLHSYRFDSSLAEKKFISLLIKACKESGLMTDHLTQKIYYPRPTPYHILQAYLFETMTTEQEITSYNQVLHNTQKFDENSDNFIEDLILKIFHADTLPAFDESQEITYPFDGMEAVFHDCVENTIRQIIKILTFDPEHKTYRANLLNIHHTRPSPALISFLNTYLNNEYPHQKTLQEAGLAWTKIISNLPFCLYTGAFNSEAKTYKKNKGVFFMYHPVSLGHHQHIVTADNITIKMATQADHLCELDPSKRTLIIALNHLLGFDQSSEQDMPYLSHSWEEQAWDRLCSRLGWTTSEVTVNKVIAITVTHHYHNGEQARFTIQLLPHQHADIKPYQTFSHEKRLFIPHKYSTNPLIAYINMHADWHREHTPLIEHLVQPSHDHIGDYQKIACAFHLFFHQQPPSWFIFRLLDACKNVPISEPVQSLITQMITHEINLFLEAFSGQSDAAIHRIRPLISPQLQTIITQAIGTTDNSDILLNLLTNDHDKFTEAEVEAALNNPRSTETYAIRGIFHNFKLLQRPSIIKRIQYEYQNHPTLTIKQIVQAPPASLQYLRTIIDFDHLCAFIKSTDDATILEQIIRNIPARFDHQEIDAALNNPLIFTSPQLFKTLLFNQKLLENKTVIKQLESHILKSPTAFLSMYLKLTQHQRSTLYKLLGKKIVFDLMLAIDDQAVISDFFKIYKNNPRNWQEELYQFFHNQHVPVMQIISSANALIIDTIAQEENRFIPLLEKLEGTIEPFEHLNINLFIKHHDRFSDQFLHALFKAATPDQQDLIINHCMDNKIYEKYPRMKDVFSNKQSQH